VDELPPDARAFLDAIARSDDPTPNERARADAHVRAALRNAGFGELPPLASHGVRTLSWSLWSKLGLFAGALIGGSMLTVMLLRPQAAPEPAAPSAPAPASPVEAAAPTPTSVETPAPAPVRPAPKPRASAPSASKSSRAPLDDEALQRELRIVANADALIRARHFAEALRVLGTNDSAANVLQEERSALRILAWCGEGVDERALRARERFLQASPQAVLAARVRDACRPEGAR
jgi:hypothetical protein